MATLDDLKDLRTAPPTGWSPRTEWDGHTGSVTAITKEPIDQRQPAAFDDLLRQEGFDPDQVDIIPGTYRYSTWTVPGHDKQYAHKFQLEQVTNPEQNIDNLLDTIDQSLEEPEADFEAWRTIVISDTHIGKGRLDGGGTENLIATWKESVEAALDGGGTFSGIHLAFLGDLIEGIVSQGGNNIAGNDLTLSRQMRVARRLVKWTIMQALGVAEKLIVSAVPGNHGETTRVQNMPLDDSYDIEILAQVQDIFEETTYADRITWYYPEEGSGHTTYQVGDTIFTAVHGHKFKGKMNGAEKWWSGMTVNGREPGASQILLAGHFHSMQVANYTADRWIFFSPALETQSTWIAEQDGSTSLSGLLYFDTEHGRPSGITIA